MEVAYKTITYKVVTVYINQFDNIIAIPHGHSEKFDLAEIDVVFELNQPYSDDQLELFLTNAMDKCYSKESDDSTNLSSLEKYLNVKGYGRAVKNRRIVIFDWYLDRGYVITPTQKKPRQGFIHLEDKEIELGKEIKEGELARAFKEAANLSITY